MAARSKAWVYGRSFAGIVGSNPAGGVDVCVECCQVEVSALGCDPSSRVFLPTVMRLCVWSRNLKNEETVARVGPQRHRGGIQKIQIDVATMTVIRRRSWLISQFV